MIPKLQIMQSTSDQVKKGNAKYGEVRDNVKQGLLADLTKPFTCVPFHVVKKWEVNEVKIVGRDEEVTFRPDLSVLITTQNEDLPREEELDAVTTLRRRTVYQFFVLLEGHSLPCVLDLKSFNETPAKQLITQMYIANAEEGKVPPAYTATFQPKTRTNKKNQEFIVLDFKVGRESTAEEIAKAFKWYQQVSKGAAKVAEDDLDAQPDEAVPF